MKAEPALLVGGEDAVGDERVDVAVQVDRAAETLQEADGAAVGVGDAGGSGLAPQPGEDDAEEEGHDLGEELGVTRERTPDMQMIRRPGFSIGPATTSLRRSCMTTRRARRRALTRSLASRER